MKRILITLTIFAIALPAMSIQLQESQKTQSDSGRTKIYSSTGSLMQYQETQRNGTVKTYNRYHQATGIYKRDGSKVKYYPKNK